MVDNSVRDITAVRCLFESMTSNVQGIVNIEMEVEERFNEVRELLTRNEALFKNHGKFTPNSISMHISSAEREIKDLKRDIAHCVDGINQFKNYMMDVITSIEPTYHEVYY